MSAKKVKVKVTKKKLKVKNILVTIVIIFLLVSTIIDFTKMPIKNIYVTGNDILNDKTIIELADLTEYPPYINTYFSNIKDKILKNEYVKNVKIKRTLSRKIYIEVEEYKPICIYKDKLVLSSKKQVENTYNIDYVPYVINDIEPIYEKFVTEISKVNNDVLYKISHIEYKPEELAPEKFLLYMTDGNHVYITLQIKYDPVKKKYDSTIDELNKYNSIIKQFGNKKGTIHLDIGNYLDPFEIKD